MATIREIAAIAGVSRSTVSLVLNNSELVKRETREKVLEVIREMKYVPNNNARNLSRKVMSSLGVIVLSDQERSRSYDFDNGVGLYSLNVIRGIASRLEGSDYSMNIEYFCAADAGESIPRLFRERRIDGAFIIGGFCEEPFIKTLLESGIPFVTVAVGANERLCDSVVSDPAQGAYESMRYLARHGHRRIGFVNCPETFRSAHLRVKGAARAMGEFALDFPQESMIFCRHNNGESGYAAMEKAWQEGLRFDGLATANPQVALGALRFLQEQGMRVPEDVSCVAYEDNSLCGYASPSLTAINIQKEAMGEAAVDLLLDRIVDPQRETRGVCIESYLVERDSVIHRDTGAR
ncbi:LacI family transcriptional regulator [Eubacteriales bacterium OttesenSCG-928-A19]|nr:LacI family transcriptional regulator [Eubacteriales bacterium OttesenSCG-928-A19]